MGFRPSDGPRPTFPGPIPTAPPVPGPSPASPGRPGPPRPERELEVSPYESLPSDALELLPRGFLPRVISHDREIAALNAEQYPCDLRIAGAPIGASCAVCFVKQHDVLPRQRVLMVAGVDADPRHTSYATEETSSFGRVNWGPRAAATGTSQMV